MFQSSTVTYGGPNGACYMSSATRRSGGDGVSPSQHCCHLLRCKVLVVIVSSMSSRLQWKKVRKQTQQVVKQLTGSHVALAIRCVFFTTQTYDFISLDYTKDKWFRSMIPLLQGHALTRKLNCDGKVNTMQTLQNLSEGFTVLVSFCCRNPYSCCFWCYFFLLWQMSLLGLRNHGKGMQGLVCLVGIPD